MSLWNTNTIFTHAQLYKTHSYIYIISACVVIDNQCYCNGILYMKVVHVLVEMYFLKIVNMQYLDSSLWIMNDLINYYSLWMTSSTTLFYKQIQCNIYIAMFLCAHMWICKNNNPLNTGSMFGKPLDKEYYW